MNVKKTALRCTLALLHLFVLEIFLSGLASAQQPNVGIQAVISSQDAEGMTRKDMTPDFLTNLENYTRQQIQIKSQAYLEANGVRDKKIVIKADGVYIETGGQKLAVIKVSDQFDMSRTVVINGIVGKEFKRVLCTRATKEPIPISYGPCAEKIKEAFGVTLMR
jgi:hypothetical protein